MAGKTASEGRNTGVKSSRATTMTSDSIAGRTPQPKAPTLTIVSRPQIDVMDTGLEDSQWHYLWVNKDDTVMIHSYYIDDYRFVRFEDVKEKLTEDERRRYLYHEDENGRVSYGDQNRLMRISQDIYQERRRIALGEPSPAVKAQAHFTETIEQSQYNGTLPKDIRVSVDEDSGEIETNNFKGGTP